MALRVKVSVYDLKTKEKIREWNKNIAHSETRQWFFKTVVWAMANGHGMEIVNEKD